MKKYLKVVSVIAIMFVFAFIFSFIIRPKAGTLTLKLSEITNKDSSVKVKIVVKNDGPNDASFGGYGPRNPFTEISVKTTEGWEVFQRGYCGTGARSSVIKSGQSFEIHETIPIEYIKSSGLQNKTPEQDFIEVRIGLRYTNTQLTDYFENRAFWIFRCLDPEYYGKSTRQKEDIVWSEPIRMMNQAEQDKSSELGKPRR